MTTPEYLDEHEVAALTGMSARYFAELRRKGGGPEFVRFGRAVRYHRDVVRAWAANRARKSTSQAA